MVSKAIRPGRRGRNVNNRNDVTFSRPFRAQRDLVRLHRWFQALTRLPHTGYLLIVPPGHSNAELGVRKSELS